MKVIKRDYSVAEFNKDKIVTAIKKAMVAGIGMSFDEVANEIATEIESYLHSVSCSEVDIHTIEELVFKKLNNYGYPNVARAYEGYRAVREFQRKENTIDNKIIGVVKGNNSDIKDNSNKNTSIISTMRDLVAEEVSKDIALRTMLPARIAQAHNDGLIYIHDLGHYLNPSFNCCLVNLEDMLQNGTVVNGKLITKPHSFRTACTIATQIIAQVASGQFGGQTITLTHLAPFVRISRDKIMREVLEDMSILGVESLSYSVENVVAKRLKDEIASGIQTFQYQINTLQTSNGRALPL